MALFAVKYDGEDEVWLVRASCLEHAEERWAKARKGKPAISAFIDVRTVPKGVVPTSDLKKLFTPMPTRD